MEAIQREAPFCPPGESFRSLAVLEGDFNSKTIIAGSRLAFTNTRGSDLVEDPPSSELPNAFPGETRALGSLKT